MDKYIEMQNNEEWWSWADAIERGEVAAEKRMRERIENARNEGLNEGLNKGLNEGLREGKIEMLRMQVRIKYQINDDKWISSLSISQLKKATVWILICNTYEQLKQKINMLA